MNPCTEISIRQATPDDAEIITHHRRAMFAAMQRGTPTELDAMCASFLPQVRRMLADGSYRGWLACTAEGRIVAGGGLLVHEWPTRPGDPNTHRAYILNVYTEPEYRRRGLARRIMNAIIDWCRKQGFRTISLHASSAGRPLYESMGFGPTNEMRIKL